MADYWQHVVQRIVEETADSNNYYWTSGNYIDRVNLLYNRSKKIDTTDRFYVIVFHSTPGTRDHSILINMSKRNDIVVSFRSELCNVLIYRSRSGHLTSQTQIDEFEKKIAGWLGNWLQHNNEAPSGAVKRFGETFHILEWLRYSKRKQMLGSAPCSHRTMVFGGFSDQTVFSKKKEFGKKLVLLLAMNNWRIVQGVKKVLKIKRFLNIKHKTFIPKGSTQR